MSVLIWIQTFWHSDRHIVLLKTFFEKRQQKHEKLPSMQKSKLSDNPVVQLHHISMESNMLVKTSVDPDQLAMHSFKT